MRPTNGDRLRGLAATVGLLLLVVGIPFVLEVARRRLLPAGFGWDDLGLLLTSPSSATLVLILVGVVTWAAWAYLTLTVVLELFAVTGRVRPPRLFGLQRGLARRLVTTASLLFVVSVPPAVASAPADAATTHTGAPHSTTTGPETAGTPGTPAHTGPPAGERTSKPRPARTVPYTVGEDDSLWSIAKEHLGDPLRFTELRELNQAVLEGKPDFLVPGTVLRLPAASGPESTDADHEAAHTVRAEAVVQEERSDEATGSASYVVRPGDTLSQVALDELGDAHRYPDIARASRATVQPDGDRLADPDHIEPGWRLTIPTVTHAPSQTEADADADATSRTEEETESRVDATADAGTRVQASPEPSTGRTLPQDQAERTTASEPDTPRASGTSSPERDTRPRTPAADGGVRSGSAQDATGVRSGSVVPDRVAPTAPDGSPRSQDPSPGESAAHPGVRIPAPAGTAPHTEQDTPHTNPWAPAPSTTPEAQRTPERAPENRATDPTPGDAATQDDSEVAQPAWLLPGLAGAGGVLAALLLAAVRRNRAEKWRYRRPGHRITRAPAHTVPVERTIQVTGQAWVGDVDALDRLLRALAGARLDDPANTKPALVAVELNGTEAVAHLADPMDLPLPWVGSGARWAAPLSAAPAETDDLLAPYPLLVTVGMDTGGHTWLLDLEQARAVTVTGDTASVAAFGRYISAELLLHPWAENATVHALATGWQVTGLSTMGHHHDHSDDASTLACVSEVSDAMAHAQQLAGQGRDTQVQDWSHAVIATARTGPTTRSALDALVTDLRHATGRVGVAAVVLDPTTGALPAPGEPASESSRGELLLDVTGGRLRIPGLGWDLAAVGLTDEELAASVAIVDVARAVADPPSAPTVAPIDQPVIAASGLEPADHDEHGSPATDQTHPELAELVPAESVPGGPSPTDDGLEAQAVRPRPADPQVPAGPWSLLPAPTAHYVEAAATTAQDVAALAPVVPPEPSESLHDADPDLDQDVAAWFDPDHHHRPRLMLLGPVTATAYGTITKQAARLKALHVEMLAYLALHPAGVTGAQLAEDFAIKPGRARSLVTGVRAWLGEDPTTGRLYVPDATQTTAFAASGTPAYQVDGLLVDVDLFQRLHSRARARGADGIEDLITALRLVRGRPFDQTRTRGWTWLFEGDRLDHTMAAIIGDVAHLLCTRAMEEDDIEQARWAAQIGRQANPDDETARLDDITIQYVTGHAELARKRLAEEIYDRTDDEWPPPDPADRTREITARRRMTPRPKGPRA